jgi:HEAT repeat protein
MQQFPVLLAGLLAAASVGPRAASSPPELVSAPDGFLEIHGGDGASKGLIARIPSKVPALRRGTPTLRTVDVDDHRVLEVRLPVRGTSAVEAWVAELPPGGRPPHVIWNGLTGPRDADEETATWLEVSSERILEYQTAADVMRCDGAPPRLFPRAYDFDAGRFRPVLSVAPPPPAQKLVARRGDPAAPPWTVRPIGDFRWTAASTTTSAGSDARALSAPAALNDGDPTTAWAEGLGGDGRGEFLTARSSGRYAIRGLRLFPGDGASLQAFRAKNRVRRFQLALGPAPEQRFDVELPEDPAADGTHWRDPYWVALPHPTLSACVTVVLTEVARGTEASPPRSYGTTAIADLSIFTELDGPEGAERLVADLSKSADCAARVPLVVGLGAPAVLPTAQAVLATHGPARECLLEALTSLEPEPKSPIVTEALVAAVAGANAREEHLVTAALLRAPAPPVGALGELLSSASAPVDDRVRAARILGALADERAPAALLAAAGHGPDTVRAAVVQALVATPALHAEALLDTVSRARTEGDARQADLVRVLPAAVKRAPDRRSEALGVLQAALGPERPFQVRARAVMALGALGGGDGITALGTLRSDSDDPVLRYLATRELGATGSEAIPALRAALGDRDPRVRETAALGLGHLGDTGAGSSLIAGAKQEPWPFVRRAELEALGKLCVPGTGDLMIRAGDRDVDEVRRAALVTLVRCADPRSRTVLLRVLGRRNEGATVRELAAALLGELGDHAAAPDLAAALRRLVNESEADIALEGVAASALRALARLGGPTAVGAAVTLAKDTRHPFRQTAVEALGTLCDPGPGAATLRAIEGGSDPSLAAAAQNAAKRCGPKVP